MEAKVTHTERFDALDRERFEEMVRSDPFQRYRNRLNAELGRAQATLEQSDHGIAVRRAQGQAAALRVALALPEQILSEMKAQKSK